jgi:two-component system, NtrC family, nitrogen regulation sensor histidine kinase NtrY
MPAGLSPERLAEGLAWARRAGVVRRVALVLSLATIPSVAATFVALAMAGPAGPDPQTVMSLLALDGLLLLALGLVVGLRIVHVLRDRSRGITGSRLHLRFILLFALLAVTPSVLMSAGSAAFFHYGVESWFSDRVRTALQDSLQVAQAYLAEHQQVIGGDALAMANDITREGPLLLRSPQAFSAFVSNQAAVRGLTEAIVFDNQRRILARSGLAFSIELGLSQIPFWAFDKVRAGEVAVLTAEGDQRVRALVMLPGFFGETYLFVGRFVDPKVLGHMEQTSAAVAEYERLEGRRSGLEREFTLVFAVVGTLLLLAAVWIGLAMASKLATPIANLIDAAEKVRSGDLSARVVEGDNTDEMGRLSRSFNRMTSQLDDQRRDLVQANRELEERRRFTETVLAGVSAGVLGLDGEGRINLPNRSACDLLGCSGDDVAGRLLEEVLPELSDAIGEVRRRPDKLVQHEIKLVRGTRTRTLLVRVAAERIEAETLGYVVTFDDITELMSAQRKAAWADVARRIAHEIKNPLTPIQLSAERLKRKYLKEIQSDPETYVKLIETIIRQVGDIGRMVDEFSSFARMPAPQIKRDDLAEITRQAVFLCRTGAPDIQFVSEIAPGKLPVECDGRLIGQALTNLLKNAVEGIRGRDGENLPQGRVVIRLVPSEGIVVVEVEDNGRGLPADNRERLTEPYVTTRAKGTGLGLAIVKKIMEDHGGDLYLEDAPEVGARVGLMFRDTSTASLSDTAEPTAAHGT